MVATKKQEVEVIQIKQDEITLCVLGKTPLLNHRLSEKAKRELLLPKKTQNKAQRQQTAKHDVVQEFRDSPYLLPEGDTLIAMPSTAFKGALRSVAVDMPGATKAQLGRLTYIEGERVGIYGIPKLHMTPVRNSGMNRTPDIRTRAIIEEWAAFVTIKYTRPMLDGGTIYTLFASAGLIVGVGDWRPEKGSGNFGTFEIAEPNDKRFKAIVENGGRKAQEAAMLRAEPYDSESQELYDWYVEEADSREFSVAK